MQLKSSDTKPSKLSMVNTQERKRIMNALMSSEHCWTLDHGQGKQTKWTLMEAVGEVCCNIQHFLQQYLPFLKQRFESFSSLKYQDKNKTLSEQLICCLNKLHRKNNNAIDDSLIFISNPLKIYLYQKIPFIFSEILLIFKTTKAKQRI